MKIERTCIFWGNKQGAGKRPEVSFEQKQAQINALMVENIIKEVEKA